MSNDEEEDRMEIKRQEPMKKMVVMGSLNIDAFFKIKRMPKVGESIGAKEDCFKAFGGKGSN